MPLTLYPRIEFDVDRDDFVVWLRWVSLEEPSSPDDPPNQGIRIELVLAGAAVLGPTIVYRRDLDTPLYLRANRAQVARILRTVGDGNTFDLGLVIHGSVANAPYAAIHHVRDYGAEALDRVDLARTPLLQLQPSTPGDRWHVAGQASVRLQLGLLGRRMRLEVID